MNKYVSAPVRKRDAMALVTGQPVYTSDLLPAHCLTVKLLRSPHASALIKNIRTDSAKRVPGIACILGTGSNSCFYDGKIVVKNVRAGGYILGDEGSGAVLGKMFLSDVMKGLAPKDVTADFFEKFRIIPNEVMESVYNRPFPNRFLSTISYFLADYTNDDYVFELITGNLRNFFTRNVCQYDYKNYPIRFVGSLAYSYAAILREVAREFGIELEIIEETPMNGLIEFHSLNIEEP